MAKIVVRRTNCASSLSLLLRKALRSNNYLCLFVVLCYVAAILLRLIACTEEMSAGRKYDESLLKRADQTRGRLKADTSALDPPWQLHDALHSTSFAADHNWTCRFTRESLARTLELLCLLVWSLRLLASV